MREVGPVTHGRRVIRTGHSNTVALPHWVRKHLRVDRGDTLYWFVVEPGEAIVSRHKVRQGGRPIGKGLERELEAAQREIDRLRRQLQERPMRVLSQGANAGYMSALRHLGSLPDLRREIAEGFRDVLAQLAHLPGARRRTRRRGAETVPAPVLTDERAPTDTRAQPASSP